jgi:ribosomal-protein-alanine N-acetyltransferase
MTLPQQIRTARLLLRRWRESDLEPFAQMNADPRVMEYFPALLSRVESEASVVRIQSHFRAHRFGLWAVELGDRHEFIGFAGLARPGFETDFTPCVEVGWRLAAEHWGHGYATEAALAAVSFGFELLGLEEIVSFTVPTNRRSIRVMEKLGMRRDAGSDFDHPRIPEGHPLRAHVLYRTNRTAWQDRGALGVQT